MRTPEPSAVEALRKACNDAINVQDACNLSGVLASWTRHQAILKDICGGNTPQYHHHPVNILFMSKVASLMNVNADCLGGVDGAVEGKEGIHDLFVKAFTYCEWQRKL